MGSSRKLLVVSNESPVPPEAQTNAPFLTEEQKIAIHDAIILKVREDSWHPRASGFPQDRAQAHRF